MDEKIRVSPAVENRARGICSALGVDVEANWRVIAAGISAIAEAFKVQPDSFELGSIFLRDLKPGFLREIDGDEIVLGVEERMGRFIDPESALSLGQIHELKVGDWLLRLANAKWHE